MQKKFVLLFAIFAISAKQQQASLRKDFFKQLTDHFQSCQPVEKRLQMGVDFALQFQLSSLDLLPTDEARLVVLHKIYDILKQAGDGDLFGHDKISFIIDNNLDLISKYLQELQKTSKTCQHMCLRILMQLGRVRGNPADYLACINARRDDKKVLSELGLDMEHILKELNNFAGQNVESPKDQSQNQVRIVPKDFKETHSINRGTLFYYKAGQFKLDITSLDGFCTDGKSMFHLKRGRGLFKLGFGDGVQKISGYVKEANISDTVKGMESQTMVIFQKKLYIRHYSFRPLPFEVYDPKTLQIDKESTDKIKLHFEKIQKELETQIHVDQPAGENQVPIVHRSLLWNKDTKSGRTLEITPLFTDGNYLFCVSLQKIAGQSNPSLIVEQYDKDFTFLKSLALHNADGIEPFAYDSNNLNFLRSSQWLTNGQILALNVANVHIYFFDMQSGVLITKEISENILMCHDPESNFIFSVRSLQGSHQTLFEVAYNGFKRISLKEGNNQENFAHTESHFISNIITEAQILPKPQEQTQDSFIQSIIYGPVTKQDHPNLQLALKEVSEKQVSAQHILILKYLDVKRQQAVLRLPSLDFIKVFKYQNVTYLSGPTFSSLIKAAALNTDSSYDLLYTLRLLQCNFTALIMCQGSLPEIMREHQDDYKNFFQLYNSVLRKKVYEKAETPIEQEIQSVCIEIMASSINILYKDNQDIATNFLNELKDNSKGINCGIFFDFFSKPENCEKLLSNEIKGAEEIFIGTCQIQFEILKDKLINQSKNRDVRSEVASSRFLKVFAQRVLMSYCDSLEKISERPKQTQKLSQQLVDKYLQEDLRLQNLKNLSINFFKILTQFFKESVSLLKQIKLPSDKILAIKQSKRIKQLLQHKSPFAQMYLCVYSQVFIGLDFEVESLPNILENSLLVISTIREVSQDFNNRILVNFSDLSQLDGHFQFLSEFIRTLSYLVSSKAYSLTKSEVKKENQNSVEKQLIQTNLLSGGIDSYFEAEFSENTRKKIDSYVALTQQKSGQTTKTDYETVFGVIDAKDSSNVDEALKLLQKEYAKVKGPVLAMIGREQGQRLSRAAFAVLLKMQDQISNFSQLVEEQNLELLEPRDKEILCSLYANACQMRKWTHEIKNTLSEQINTEVEQKFRKEKQAKLDAQQKVFQNQPQTENQVESEIQIDTTNPAVVQPESVIIEKFFSDEELKQIEEEQEKLFANELVQLYDSVVEKAKYLIKIQPPNITNNFKSSSTDNENDILGSWKEMQMEIGQIKSISTKERDLRSSCSNEVITILQLQCSVERIQQQVEEVYVSANRRVAGLHIFQRVLELVKFDENKKSFQDTMSWFCSALRDNKNIQVHYLHGITGCGHILEAAARNSFFNILNIVVQKLSQKESTEQDIGFFFSCLKWRFLGRDHDSLSNLKLFQTLHDSQNLQIHWGKPITTEFQLQQGQNFKFNFKNTPENSVLIRSIFDRYDSNKNGTLNYSEFKEFLREMCTQYGQSWDQHESMLDSTFNKLQKDNKVNFETIYKHIQHKKKTSNLAKEILQLFDLIFSSSISRIIESDFGTALKLTTSSTSQLSKAKSVLNPNKSELLLDELFSVIFQELERYLKILQMQQGIDWIVYAQKRNTFSELFDQSVDSYNLLDIPQAADELQQVSSCTPIQRNNSTSETEEEKKLRELQADQAKIEEKQKQHLRNVPRLYSESFLLRLLRLVNIFTCVSGNSSYNLLNMVQRIANPNQMAILLSLLVSGSPKVKYQVLQIFNGLVKIDLPVELYEETINIHMNNPESSVQQILRRIQPHIQLKRSKFMTFLHHYALSIRQKLWTKSAIESEGQYEISCEILKCLRIMFESQKSDQHPWRIDLNEIIQTTLADGKKLTRARETEVVLSLLRGADFCAFSPYQQIEVKGKDKFTIVGYVDRDWLKRSSNSTSDKLKIQHSMTVAEQKILCVNEGKGEQMKLLNPDRAKIIHQNGSNQFQFTSDLLKQLLDSTDLASETTDDIQQMSNKCMVLKMIDGQLQQKSKDFIVQLKNSGHYENLLKFVCKESSLEIKGEIMQIEWLEQICFNARKIACESQTSLLKPQETSMTLVKDKIYASAVNSTQKGDKTYTRARLLMAVNYAEFVQRKDIKLVNGADIIINNEEESQNEQQVALIEPSHFFEGDGIEIMNLSIGVITFDTDLNKMIQLINTYKEKSEKYQTLNQKTIFLVSQQDFSRLSQICSGQSTSTSKNEQTQDQDRTFDQVFQDELINHGGFSQLIASKTKQAHGVENKTKALFQVLEQINNGIVIAPEEDQSEQQNTAIKKDIPTESTSEILNILVQKHHENKDRQHPDSARTNSNNFFRTTRIEGNNLADLYEKSIRRLFNMYCRAIFWNLIQKDKISKIFDFLLASEEDMKAFITFLKVIGNECFITQNKANIKGFELFIKQVIQTAISNQKFQKLLNLIVDDLIDQYRSSLPALTSKASFISLHFRTESQASKLMNPNIVIPIIKCILKTNEGFALLSPRIDELISMLLAINSVFIGDYSLKDRYWSYIIQLIEKCEELPSQKIESILKLPILKSIFDTFEYHHTGDQDETQKLQRHFKDDTSSDIDGISRTLPWKILIQRKENITRRYVTHQNRSNEHIVHLEVLYKFYLLSLKVPSVNFFFRSYLSNYLHMHTDLIQQGADGELSKHLYFMKQLNIDQKIVTQQLIVDMKTQVGPVEIISPDSSNTLISLSEQTSLKPGQQVVVASDPEFKNVVAKFNFKEIKSNCAFTSIYSDRAFIKVVFPRQNFVVRLQQDELKPENFEHELEGAILQSYQNKFFHTTEGVFKTESNRVILPVKDHLILKQVNFGKGCTIALLANGSVIGFGQSKHRHFINKPAKTNTGEEENIIPLNVKPASQNEKKDNEEQRQIVTVKTFKRTTVCLTKSGHIYACGDKFARNIKLPAENFKAFGFYPLPVSNKKEKPDESKPEEVKKQPEVPKEQESIAAEEVDIGNLFQDANDSEQVVEKPAELAEVVVNDQNPVQVAAPQAEEQPKDELADDQKSNSDEDFKSVGSQEQKNEGNQQLLPEENKVEQIQIDVVAEQALASPKIDDGEIQPNQVEIEMQDQEKDEKESDYVPKEENQPVESKVEDEKVQEVMPVEDVEVVKVELKAQEVWISDTASSNNIVILGLFKSSEGTLQFMTIGNNSNGLLGQGNDKKRSEEFQIVDFGFEIKQVDEVVVGQNHFIVRADGKVFAWGCYNSDSEDRIIWQPKELTFFQQHKVKSIVSGELFTCALIEQSGGPDYFISGKFAPLWQENQFKSLKYFNDFQIESFRLFGQNLVVSTKQVLDSDLTDVKVVYNITPDFSFRPNQKIYQSNQELYDKIQKQMTLEKPDLQKKVLDLIQSAIFSRIKDHNIDDVQWQDINLEELKIDESFGMNDEQKRAWLLLVVNYCRHIWSHISLIGGKIKKTKGMPIYQNFIKYRHNVPMCLKNKYLKTLLQDLPKDDKGSSIHISRKRANELRKEGQVDTKGEWTVFSQVSKELRKNKFHGMHINSQNKRAWFVKFIGEAALDDGGLFRESITELCNELQSTALELFIPSANQANKLGENRDKWILNPQATSDLHLKMYEFVGSLFGMSLRSGILLNLNLAPIFWKTLTDEPLKVNDIKDIDIKFIQNLDTYSKQKADNVPEEQFKKDFELTMTTLNSAQKQVDLVQNGQKIPVTYQNLDSYIQKCINLRLNESKEQYRAILKGFEQTFSSQYLKVLSWQDMELKVVGNEEVDIARLKEITTYSKCSATHDVIKRFWKVLTSFDNEDRKKYLRFVWGRTRLPLKEDTDIELHTIQLDENKSKNDTPFGRTCYFRLELPPYQSEAIMRERLLFVINNCTSIDGDYERSYNVDEVQENQLARQAEQADREQAAGSDSEQERREEQELQMMRERARQQDYGSEGSVQEDNAEHDAQEEEEE